MASGRRGSEARTGRRTERPYVICHMVSSVVGRIVTDGWRLKPGLGAEYERTAATFDADGWIIGRISREPYAGRAKLPGGRVGPSPARRLRLLSVERRRSDLLWVRYRVRRGGRQPVARGGSFV
jgi:hypothetical protein